MKTVNYLGMDFGAGSGRGMLGSFDGKKITLREVNRFLNSPVPDGNGGFNWDTHKLYNSMKESFQTLKAEGTEIKSFAIDTWAQDFGVIRPDGHLKTKPYSYRTAFFADGVKKITEKLSSDEIFAKTGSDLSPVTTLSQILADRIHCPDYLEENDHILFMANLLGYILTGEESCDCSVPSMTLMYSNKDAKWSDDILKTYGINKKIFAPIVPHFEKVGMIRDKRLLDEGIKPVPLISVAHHDTVSAFATIDGLGLGKDTIYISCGTWTVMSVPIDDVVLSPEAHALGLCNETGLNGQRYLAKSLTGMWIEQESQRYWREKGLQLDYKHLDHYVEFESKDDIIIDTQLPLFAGVSKMPETIQQYCRDTNQRVPETVEDIFACIMHNMGRDYAKAVKNLMKFTPVKIKRIQIVGGGSKNIPLAKFLSKETGLPVYTGPVEATVTGNILAQMVASGEISSVSDAKEIILNSFDIKEIR